MKKELLRREFFKLKSKGHSYAQCRVILKARFDYEIHVRTLKRWMRRLDEGGWDFRDASRRPHTIHEKITPKIEEKVIRLRKQTGWGQEKLYPQLKHLGISQRSIKRIIHQHGLCRPTKTKGKRVKWVRWQRKHSNSLWQVDHTDELEKFDCYTLSIIDDCSRYSIGIIKLKRVTTNAVTYLLDQLIALHGKPREILTDNGSAYGGKSRHSRIDRWCRRRGIHHIRCKVHSPTTCGKVERLFRTMDEELQYCNNDFELFRLRYNHFRPHSSLKGITPAQKYFSFSGLF